MANIYRHGDLLFRSIEYLPENIPKRSGNIVEYGEVTGHKHVFNGMAELFGHNQVTHVKVEQDTVLTHEEHKPIKMEPGFYEVVREREYNPFEESWRSSLD
jgi:hypothetical protein